MTDLPTPTGRELDILKVLWERGPCTVREVYKELARGQEERCQHDGWYAQGQKCSSPHGCHLRRA